MKVTIYLLTSLLLLAGCSTSTEDSFSTFIGTKKAAVLEHSNAHYGAFLEDRFEGDNALERTISFLQFLDTAQTPVATLAIDSAAAAELLDRYETSGLRMDFMLFVDEDYDTLFQNADLADTTGTSIASSDSVATLTVDALVEEPIFESAADSLAWELRQQQMQQGAQERWNARPHYNPQGRYQYGLKTYCANDTIVMQYMEAKDIFHTINPPILTQSLLNALKNEQQLSEGVRIVLLFELYFPLLQASVNPK